MAQKAKEETKCCYLLFYHLPLQGDTCTLPLTLSRFVTSCLSTVPSYPVSAELETICLHSTDLILLL